MHNHFSSIFHFCFINSKLCTHLYLFIMLFQEVIEFVMDHIRNSNKENSIRMPLADFAFIPEAEAGVIEDTDAKFHNVDVR